MEKISTDQNQILKDITSGKYRNCYLVYNRKSTDEPNNQKNSLKYQKAANTRAAFKEHLKLAPVTIEGFCRDGIVSERHSGFKEDMELVFGADKTVQYRIDRPKFYRLVQWLHNRCFKGVIFLCYDRASRNRGDDNILRRLKKAGTDIRFALADYEDTASGELHMDIDGMFAAHHSRTTSEKVTLTIKDSRARGIWTNKAPVGYLNPGSMAEKPKDPTRAPLILRFAELVATGDWSLSDVARWAIEQGFTMPPMRRRRTEDEILAEEEDDIQNKIDKTCRLPTANSIHKILTNRFYTGHIVTTEGEWIPSRSHEAIIPEHLFRKVQEQLRKKNTSSRYKETLDYPLRGFVRCALCRRLYTPYLQKGHVYYGARCAPQCTNPCKSFNSRFIMDNVATFVDGLSFTDAEIKAIESRTSSQVTSMEQRRADAEEADERKRKKIREDLAYINTNRLSLLKAGAYTPEALSTEEIKLRWELSELDDANQPSYATIGEAITEVVKLSELLKSVALYYRNAIPEEKEEIIKAIVSELTLDGKTLKYQCRIGLQPLANRFIPVCDPTGWLSETIQNNKDIRECLNDLEKFLIPCQPQGP